MSYERLIDNQFIVRIPIKHISKVRYPGKFNFNWQNEILNMSYHVGGNITIFKWIPKHRQEEQNRVLFAIPSFLKGEELTTTLLLPVLLGRVLIITRLRNDYRSARIIRSNSFWRKQTKLGSLKL